MSNNFFVFLPSNVSDYPDNQPNKFRVHLPKPIYFNGDWVCGLHSISYPYSWPSTIGTLDDQWIKINFFDELNKQQVHRVPVPKASHIKVEKLRDFLNSTLEHQSNALDSIFTSKGLVDKPTVLSPPKLDRKKRAAENIRPVSPPQQLKVNKKEEKPQKINSPPRTQENINKGKELHSEGKQKENENIDKQIKSDSLAGLKSPSVQLNKKDEAHQKTNSSPRPEVKELRNEKERENANKIKITSKDEVPKKSFTPTLPPLKSDELQTIREKKAPASNNVLTILGLAESESEDDAEIENNQTITVEEENFLNKSTRFSISKYGKKYKGGIKLLKNIIDSIEFQYNVDFGRFRLIFGHPNIIHISFSSQLGYVLGFENPHKVKHNEIAKYGCDLRGGFSSFAVYVKGLTENMIIGNSLSSLLRVVSVAGSNPSEYNEKIYDTPIYARVLPREINEIEIELRTMDNGRLVPFSYGTVLVVLIFKKVINF
ncbi:unnamed protein product [Meloidogyne enterolobii]|uniref:Uncharacterized protein n=1 Tax=Meloidogyne enterolobii TaxID=390850 RepID=A0ACB0ZFL0_MELEN